MFVNFFHFIGGRFTVWIVVVVADCVVIYQIADMYYCPAFTPIEYLDTEIKVIRAFKGQVRISDYSYIILELKRLSPPT